MYGYSKLKISTLLFLVFLIGTLGLTACMSRGGKGLARARDTAQNYIEEIAEPEMETSDSPMTEAVPVSNDQEGIGVGSLQYSLGGSSSLESQDPFGLIPPDWPVYIEFHPAAKVAQRQNLASDGYFLLALIPSSQATILGVQTFHIDRLSGWESLEVEEGSQSDNESVLTIIAERNDSWLKITAEQAQHGYLATLENVEFWETAVGTDPIIVRIYFVPVGGAF